MFYISSNCVSNTIFGQEYFVMYLVFILGRTIVGGNIRYKECDILYERTILALVNSVFGWHKCCNSMEIIVSIHVA